MISRLVLLATKKHKKAHYEKTREFGIGVDRYVFGGSGAGAAGCEIQWTLAREVYDDRAGEECDL
jgi:hypothetical protein